MSRFNTDSSLLSIRINECAFLYAWSHCVNFDDNFFFLSSFFFSQPMRYGTGGKKSNNLSYSVEFYAFLLHLMVFFIPSFDFFFFFSSFFRLIRMFVTSHMPFGFFSTLRIRRICILIAVHPLYSFVCHYDSSVVQLFILIHSQ